MPRLGFETRARKQSLLMNGAGAEAFLLDSALDFTRNLNRKRIPSVIRIQIRVHTSGICFNPCRACSIWFQSIFAVG